MIPRIQGKIGQATEGETKGKWYFQMWLTSIGGGGGKSLGQFGPWDTQEIAQNELKTACRLACETVEKNVTGEVSGKYIDMKTNEVKDWDKKKSKSSKKSTMVELVQELENLPSTPAITEMIKEAKAGEYHDYKNQKYICGKMEAARKLRNAGLTELAKQIESGVYDETADQFDKEQMKKDCPEEMWKTLGL